MSQPIEVKNAFSSSLSVGGTVAVSSMPAVSGSVSVSSQPALAFSTDKVDVTGSSVSVSSLPAITGSVSASITTNPVITLDKPSYSIDIQNCNTSSQTIRASAGCLSKLYLMHVGGSQFCYFKIYNASSASSSDTPLATFGINKDSSIMIDTSSMNFSGGLCVRGTDNYGASDNTAPSGTLHLVAFLNGYYE